jgi:sporulation integral membrane protein YtvI
MAFIYRQLPDSWSKNLAGVKTDTFSALLGYFRALLILIGFTFIEVTLGLFILGVDYALLLGLIVAISDAIPIVGTGLVMVPWIAWNFISGNTQLGLGLLIIYILGIIMRQVMEPKIVGDQIGLHPLVTLASMYIGLEVFGVLGMIIGPVSIIILKNLQNSGVLRIWKE